MNMFSITMQVKLNVMQTQMAQMAAVIADLQRQIVELRCERNQEVPPAVPVSADDSEGYDSDEAPLRAGPRQRRQPCIEMPSSPFVMVARPESDADSGYGDSDDE